MSRFLCLIVVIFLAGCNQSIFYKLSTDEKLANKALRKAALRIQKKAGMIPSGDASQMMDEIKMLGLSFKYYQDITIEEGRELLITAVNEFLDVINNDEKIRPYLNNYPFEPKNVEIEIFLRHPTDSDFVPEKLRVIVASNGFLEYQVDDPKTNLFKTIYKESYEEALRKINNPSKKAA